MNDHDRIVERLRNALAAEEFGVPVQTIAQHAEQSRTEDARPEDVRPRYRAISTPLPATDAACIPLGAGPRGSDMGGQVAAAVTLRRLHRWGAVGVFLKTIPGALTAIATLLTAIAGLLAALAQVGVITIRSPIVANPPAVERTVPHSTIGGTVPGGPQGSALVYLDELTPLQQSWYREGARAVNGRDFARSVSFRQPYPGRTQTTVFNLGRHYSQLRFTIGLWDDSDPALQSKCQLFADQQIIYDSGTMTRGTSAEVVRDVSDAFDLTISCTPTQAGSADGEVVLADAQLTAKPGQAPSASSP